MKHDKNILSFTVNESLYVEEMEGIEEILAISLDPDIAIETFYEDVQIRGLIILQGEYRKTSNKQEKAHQKNEESLQVMEKMIETEEDQVMFSHRFPVEVTIAENRIKDMNDVQVEVVAFDYEIPSSYRLNITAELHIHGISNDDVEMEKQDEELEKIKEKRTEDVESDLATSELDQENSQEKAVYQEGEEGQTNVEQDLSSVKNTIDQEQEEENVRRKEKLTKDEDTIDVQLTENEELEKSDEVEDVLFLTDLFAHHDEGSVATMRIHIIQEDDTIESVAKRYDMSALQLMKDNQLHVDEMTPGKLIYIDLNK